MSRRTTRSESPTPPAPPAQPPAPDPTPPPAPAPDPTPAPTPPPAPSQPVSLADLSPEDRARLVAELESNEQAKRNAMDDAHARIADARQEAIAELIPDRAHLEGCPGGRVEAYESRRPPNPKQGIPAADVTVARCVECGGSTVKDQPYAETVKQLDQKVAAAIA